MHDAYYNALKEMNTCSKSVSNIKPYKTNDTRVIDQEPIMAEKPEENRDVSKMSVDEKLIMLITSVAKLEKIPQDIEKMRESITGMQNDLKAIPVLQDKVKTLETSMKLQQSEVDTGKKITAALEVSVTNIQKDVDEFRAKIKEMQEKMDKNKKLIQDFETKMRCDEKKIEDLTKNALKSELEKSDTARKFRYRAFLKTELKI